MTRGSLGSNSGIFSTMWPPSVETDAFRLIRESRAEVEVIWMDARVGPSPIARMSESGLESPVMR